MKTRRRIVWPAALAGVAIAALVSGGEAGPGGRASRLSQGWFEAAAAERTADRAPACHPSGPGQVPGAARAFRDRAGEDWSVREEWSAGGSIVIVARDGSSGPAASVSAIPQPGGFNVRPELGFDLRNRPILAWSNSDGLRSDVRVRDLESGRTWRLDRMTGAAAPAPCVLADGLGRLWAFWNRPAPGGRDGLGYRVFDGTDWSPLQSVPIDSRGPVAGPAAVADGTGGIWLSWSGWDGRRHSIWTAHHDGTAWSAPVNVTGGDPDGNDAFPAIALAAGGVPVVAWNRSVESGNIIMTSTRSRGQWGGGSRLPGGADGLSRPRLDAAGTGVEAVWTSAREGVVRVRSTIAPREPAAERERPAAPGYAPPPGKNDDMYTCFGDSITYGSIHDEDAPSLGYVPRLQALAGAGFGPSVCFNAGSPGEYTWQGLGRIRTVVSSYPSRYVLIMEGTNDVGANEISMDAAAFNLGEMAKRCLERGALPVLATIIPRRDWAWQTTFYRNRLLALNDKIRGLAAALAVPLVEQFQAFNDYPASDGGLLSLLDDDLKHPSLKGYQVMAQAWFAGLRLLPFPPAGVSIRRRDVRLDPPSGPVRLTAADGRMTIVSWIDNPKIGDPAVVRGYHVYRKRAAEPDNAYQRLALVTGPRLFVDRTINRAETYVYALTTVRTDGLEGAWSAPQLDR